MSAICNPAIRLPSTGRAAIPATSPATPADASRLAPIWRTFGNVISAAPVPMITISTITVRTSTLACVWTRRACRLSAVSIGWAWMIASPTPAASRTSSHVSDTIEPTAAAVRMPRTNDMPSSAWTHRNSSASSASTTSDGLSM